MKISALDDKQKIKELLSLTNSREEDVFLCKDLRPGMTSKFPKNDLDF